MKKYFLPIALLALSVGFMASCVKDRNTNVTVVIPPVNTGSDTVIFYWNFNTDSTDLFSPTTALLSGAGLSYSGASYDTVQPGTTVNALGADMTLTASSAALRLRNPATGPFILTLPTTGYKDIVVKYAEDRTSKGASVNSVSYTVDGVNWITTAISAYATYNVDSVDTYNGFQLITLDFSSDPAVNNNAKFQVQINFGTGATNTSGNDRFDNITVYGIKE